MGATLVVALALAHGMDGLRWPLTAPCRPTGAPALGFHDKSLEKGPT